MNIDTNAIPLLTALGDVLGTGLLTLAFFKLSLLHDVNALPNEENEHSIYPFSLNNTNLSSIS